MNARTEPAASSLRPLYRSRLVRPQRPGEAHEVVVPESRLLEAALPVVDWSDAYAVSFPGAPPGEAQEWRDAIFHAPPRWVAGLLALRELLVRAVGIERGGRHAFDIVARTDDAVVLGIDQSHLSFRASVLIESRRVVLTTAVKVHNRRGRAYWAVVRRVHPVVVRTMLTRAARRLASPSRTTTGDGPA